METVIKHTKTIAEYKQLKEFMENTAKTFAENHKQAVEHWEHGEISKVWIDANSNICIEYNSGSWWHYNNKGEWW